MILRAVMGRNGAQDAQQGRPARPQQRENKAGELFQHPAGDILTRGDHPPCSSHRRRVSLTVETK